MLLNSRKADDYAAGALLFGTLMTARLVSKPMLADALQQHGLVQATQWRRVVQGNQQGAQFQSAQLIGRRVSSLFDCKAGLVRAKVDDEAFLFLIVPGQQAA
ncbi:hypothetical protein M2C68_18720, partial [Pseudomonas sp. BAgro211]|nr:hypothetical protein [Pseudomonas sp. BAgro211]